MKILSPAKVNLTLNVGRLLSDGYHELRSIFHLIELFDEVEIVESDEMRLNFSVELGIDAEENLVMKAARAFKAAYSIEQNYTMSVKKNIPHGAGLAGGSSNAAAVLYGLAKLHDVEILSTKLMGIAGVLGSDTAAFLQDSAANLMVGRGDELAQSLPSAQGIWLVVAMHPKSHTPTAHVYKKFDEDPAPTKSEVDMLEALHEKSAPKIAAALYNNLSEASFAFDEKAREVHKFLAAHDLSLSALLSGSGAASFAVCASEEDAEALARDCASQGYFAHACSFARRGVHELERGEE